MCRLIRRDDKFCGSLRRFMALIYVDATHLHLAKTPFTPTYVRQGIDTSSSHEDISNFYFIHGKTSTTLTTHVLMSSYFIARKLDHVSARLYNSAKYKWPWNATVVYFSIFFAQIYCLLSNSQSRSTAILSYNVHDVITTEIPFYCLTVISVSHRKSKFNFTVFIY